MAAVEYVYDDDEPFHPAMTFTERAAYFGINMIANATVGRGNHSVTRRQTVLAFVSSDRELIDASHDALSERGLSYPVERFPIPPPARFSARRIQAWLTAAESAVDPAPLYRDIRQSFTDRVEYVAAAHPDVVTLFVIGSYVHRLFDTYPLLLFHGSKRTRKSKTGKIIAELAFNGIEATAVTGAALYMAVEAHSATLILDDREDLAGDDERAIDAMLRVGYKRGGQTMRGSWDSQSARFYGLYGPKVITNTQGIGDDALLSRVIVVNTQPATDQAKARTSENVGAPLWRDKRDDLLTWALAEWSRVRIAYARTSVERIEVEVGDKLRSLDELDGRSWELWRPLIALATYFEDQGVSGLVQRVAAFALESFDQVQAAEVDTVEGAILVGLLRTYVDEEGFVKARPRELAEWIGGIRPETIGRVLTRLGFDKRRLAGGVVYHVRREALERAALLRGISLDDEVQEVQVGAADAGSAGVQVQPPSQVSPHNGTLQLQQSSAAGAGGSR